MKIFFIIIVLIISIPAGNLSAQDMTAEQKDLYINLELGYFIQAKESFRKNYDHTLFVGESDVPLSIGLDLAHRISDDEMIFVNLKRVNNTLSTNNDFMLAIMPAIAGYRYYIVPPWQSMGTWALFGGAGVGFYWARFTADYYYTNTDPTPLGEVTDSEDHFGYGAQAHLGLEKILGPSMQLGLTAAYDIVNMGDTDEGKLGNIGGFFFSLKIGSRF